MSLNDAAHELRERIQSLGLEARIADFEERAEATRIRREALVRDWTAFAQALSGLVERMDEESFDLGDAGLRAAVAVSDAAERLDEGSENVEAAVAGALGALAGWSGGAREMGQVLPPLLFERALAPGSALALDAQELVDTALASIEPMVGLVGAEFLEVAENSREMARLNGDVSEKVSQGASAALAGDFEDWARRMRHVVEHVDQHGYRPAREHAPRAIEAAVAQCRAEQGPVFRSLAGVLDGVLERVTELLEVVGRVDLVSFDRTTQMTEGASDLATALADGRAALALAREFIEARVRPEGT